MMDCQDDRSPPEVVRGESRAMEFVAVTAAGEKHLRGFTAVSLMEGLYKAMSAYVDDDALFEQTEQITLLDKGTGRRYSLAQIAAVVPGLPWCWYSKHEVVRSSVRQALHAVQLSR